MASVIVASITAVPLVLLVWDLTRKKADQDDRFAGQARSPVA